ncbi:hypothetical protein [Polyangium sp. 15x6]|uniref:hypothetical protein n=1 Tax=Polyangium sp. 15x6 TaxID=3042687 RepID=UPI00249C3869|nr:hypothetical protein [Polyangium sp. 15x6]MDI3288251.1 hypothetical protein [Polyangium sp. 15x6]
MRSLSVSARLACLAASIAFFCVGCGGKVVIDREAPPDDPPDLTPPPCGRDPLGAPAPGDAIGLLRYGFTAQWRGMAKTPAGWVPYEEYPVEITFDALGRYEAMCLFEECAAFYYGTSQPVPEQTYEIAGLVEDGTGIGKIRISFAGTSGSVETGDLTEIRLSQDLGQLNFAFFPSWSGKDVEAVRYELRCVAE